MFKPDTTFRAYDAAGNVSSGWERGWNNSQGTGYRKEYTRSYYGADGKLRAQQGYHELGGMYFTGERRGYFSEYRYDALGRRVLVRTRRDGLCNTNQTSTVDCTGGIERFVWAGDNVLWEMRGPGGNTETAERLEQEYATGEEYGIVGYTHAGGVDRPLVAYKTMGGNSGAEVIPHMNWRGLFSRGTNASGGTSTVAVEWPGFRTTAYHSMGQTQETTKNWMGSLLEGQRDAGGQMYMRNRYYDPATGQFTQTDPIGIAGGLNTYGFANGDPVTYSDPYGLRACEPPTAPKCKALATTESAGWGALAGGSLVAAGVGVCAFFSGGVCAAAGPAAIPAGAALGATTGALLEEAGVSLSDGVHSLGEAGIDRLRRLGARVRQGVFAGLLGIGFVDGADGSGAIDTTPTNPCGDRVTSEQCKETTTKVDTSSAPPAREPEQ
jgi:RHS repeat-associated protein